MTIALSGTQTCPDTSFSGQHLMTNFKNRPLKKINNITQCPNTLHKSTSTDKNWPLIFPTIYRYVYFSQCVQITQVLFSRRVYLPAETKMLICSDLLDLLDKYSKWCFINTIKHAFFTSVFHTILKNPPASFDWFTLMIYLIISIAHWIVFGLGYREMWTNRLFGSLIFLTKGWF